MKHKDLTLNDVKAVMSQKILIGCDSEFQKEFVYLPYTEDYQIWHKGKLVNQGKGMYIEELLDFYNYLENQMKTSDLQGAELDYWVAKAEGYDPVLYRGICFWSLQERDYWIHQEDIDICSYSTAWSQGGPLIEKYAKEITAYIMKEMDEMDALEWWENINLPDAMRAIVASVYGDTVDEC